MQEDKTVNEENHYVVIGRILDTYGLKGELKVQTYLERKHWSGIKRVFLKRKGGDYVPFFVERTKAHGGEQIILKFEGFNRLEDVERFKGAKVFLPKEELPKKKKDEYYYFELEGLEVFSESGKFLGRITGILEQKAYDFLEVDKGKLYIPFVKALVKEIKLEEGKIIVDESLSYI